MGRLVQQPPPPQLHRRPAAGRVRGGLLCEARGLSRRVKTKRQSLHQTQGDSCPDSAGHSRITISCGAAEPRPCCWCLSSAETNSLDCNPRLRCCSTPENAQVTTVRPLFNESSAGRRLYEAVSGLQDHGGLAAGHGGGHFLVVESMLGTRFAKANYRQDAGPLPRYLSTPFPAAGD